MSKVQDDKNAIRKIMHNSIIGSSFLLFPILAGMAVVAPSFVSVLMTEKWLPCVPYIYIFCIYYVIWPMTTTWFQALYAIGRSDIVLYCEITKRVLDIITLVLTVKYGPKMIAIGTVTISIIMFFVSAVPCSRLTGYSFFKQVKELIPNILVTILMTFITYIVVLLHLSNMLTLILQILIGIFIYATFSYFFKLEGLCLLLKKINIQIPRKV